MLTERTPYNSMTFGNSLAVRVDEGVTAMSISPSSRDVVLASRRGLFIVDLDDPFSLPRWLHHVSSWEIADVQWSPHVSKPYWVVSTSNQKAMVWNLALPSSNAIEHVLHGHTRAITDINFHHQNPQLLATCSVDSFILNWDLRDPSKPCQSFSDWVAGANQVKWNIVNPHILASSHEGRIHIWDRRKGSIPLRTINGHARKVNGINFNRTSESELMTCSTDGTVKLWDYNKDNYNSPKYTINTGFPVWRARYTPFGEGCAIMPLSAGNNAVYLVNIKDQSGVSHLDPTHVFSGHTEPVHEFIWRSRSGGNNNNNDRTNVRKDDREFQLVTWSKDHDLRLWPVSDSILNSVHHEREIKSVVKSVSYLSPIAQHTQQKQQQKSLPQLPSSPIKQKPIYTSYWAEPADYTASSLINLNSPIPKTPNGAHFNNGLSTSPNAARFSGGNTIGPTQVIAHRSISSPAAYMRRRRQKLENKDLHLRWLQGVRMGHKSEFELDIDESNNYPQTIMGLVNGYSIENLGEELGALANKFPKVRFEKINVSAGICTLSLVGPWGDNGEGIFVRFDISFPKNYPNDSDCPQFTIEENAGISDNQAGLIKTELDKLAEKFTSINKVCLEPCLRFLLDNVTLEDYDFAESITSQSDYDNSEYFSTTDEEVALEGLVKNIDKTQVFSPVVNKYFQKFSASADEDEEDDDEEDDDESDQLENDNGCTDDDDCTDDDSDSSSEITSDTDDDSEPTDSGFTKDKSITQDDTYTIKATREFSGVKNTHKKTHSEPKVFLSSLLDAELTGRKPKRSKFDSTPAPRLCGATWDNEGRLVYFTRKVDAEKNVSNAFHDVNKNKRNNRFGASGFGARMRPFATHRKTKLNRHDPVSTTSGECTHDEAIFTSEDDSIFSVANGNDDGRDSKHNNSECNHSDQDEGDHDDDDYDCDSESEESFDGNYKRPSRWMLTGQFKAPIRAKRPSIYLGLAPLNEPESKSDVPSVVNTVSIRDFKALIPTSKQLAIEYEIFGKTPEDLCRHNSEVARNHGFNEIAECWKLLSIILPGSVSMSRVANLAERLNIDMPPILDDFGGCYLWGSHPFGRRWIIEAMFKFFEKQHNTQMLAYMTCILSTNVDPLSGDVELTIPGLKTSTEMPSTFDKLSSVPAHIREVTSGNNSGNLSFPFGNGSGGNWYSPHIPVNSPLDANFSHGEFFSAAYSPLASSFNSNTSASSIRMANVVTRRVHLSCIPSSKLKAFDHDFARLKIQTYSDCMSDNGSVGTSVYQGYPPFGHARMNSSTFTGVDSRGRQNPSPFGFPDPRGMSTIADRESRFMPQLKVEMVNEDLFDIHQVQNVPLLDPAMEMRFQSYRKQYAAILYSWELITESLEILKFNYITPIMRTITQDNCVINGKSEYNDLYSTAIGLRLVSKPDNIGQSHNHDIDRLSLLKTDENDSFINYYKCHYCGLCARSRFVVCTVCEHILHTACASEWWGSRESQCPSGCGCNCLSQQGNGNVIMSID